MNESLSFETQWQALVLHLALYIWGCIIDVLALKLIAMKNLESFAEREEEGSIPKMGDYVSAPLTSAAEKNIGNVEKDLHHNRQGVVVKDNGDGTLEVETETGEIFQCIAERASIINEEKLPPKTREFLHIARSKAKGTFGVWNN